MEFYQVVKTRRSIRSYKEDQISEEVLNRILEATRMAPSGSNRQPWKFILLEDAEVKRRIASACNGQMFIATAPIIVVALGRNIRFNRGDWMGDYSVLVDVSIAFTHLILAARVEGLGTCWIGSFDNSAIKDLLGVPEEYNIVAITPIGFPKEEFFRETEERRPMKEIVLKDRWRNGE